MAEKAEVLIFKKLNQIKKVPASATADQIRGLHSAGWYLQKVIKDAKGDKVILTNPVLDSKDKETIASLQQTVKNLEKQVADLKKK